MLRRRLYAGPGFAAKVRCRVHPLGNAGASRQRPRLVSRSTCTRGTHVRGAPEVHVRVCLDRSVSAESVALYLHRPLCPRAARPSSGNVTLGLPAATHTNIVQGSPGVSGELRRNVTFVSGEARGYTVDPMQRFRTYLLPGFLPSLRTKGGPIGFQGGRIDSCCSIFELF